MKRKNVERCRNLRKNQTDAERKLWSILRNRQLVGVKFRRQFSVGRYILDFYSPEYRLGIEADGGQHYEDKGRQQDELRTRELSRLGVEILRFSDWEILNNIEGVYAIVQERVKKKKTSPLTSILSPMGRGREKHRREKKDKAGNITLPDGARVRGGVRRENLMKTDLPVVEKITTCGGRWASPPRQGGESKNSKLNKLAKSKKL